MAKSKNAASVATLVILIFLVVGVFSAFALLSNKDGKSDNGTLSLVVDGAKVTENTSLDIMGKTITVDGCKDWKYEIVPLLKNHNTVYYAEGVLSFENAPGTTRSSEIEDWTKGFDVVKSKSALTVNSTTILKVLQKIHNTQNVMVNGKDPNGMVLTIWNEESRTFKLVISSSDGKQSIALSFVIPMGV